jgi:hypothetical protein
LSNRGNAAAKFGCYEFVNDTAGAACRIEPPWRDMAPLIPWSSQQEKPQGPFRRNGGRIAGLIAVVIIAAATTLGTSISAKFGIIANNLS